MKINEISMIFLFPRMCLDWEVRGEECSDGALAVGVRMGVSEMEPVGRESAWAGMTVSPAMPGQGSVDDEGAVATSLGREAKPA